MVNLNVDPASDLKTLIAASMDAGFVIYTNGGTPTSDLPDEFITIEQNGGIKSRGIKRSTADCVLMVSIYRKLLSTEATNSVREDFLLSKFQSLFSSPLISSEFSFSIDKEAMVYRGKNIQEGYSTRILNVKVNINY